MADLPDWYAQGSTTTATPAPESAPAPSTPSAPETEKLPDWYETPVSGDLKGAVKYGSRIPPEQAAQTLKLQAQTGLPPDLIERNKDQVDSVAKQQQMDPAQIQDQSPNLASWVAKNYLHAAIAGPDLYNLQSIESLAKDVGAGAYRGSLEMERSAIGLKGLFGMADPEDAANVADIESRIAASKAKPNQSPAIYGKLAEQLPIMGGATVAGGAAALLGGAGVGAAGVATAAAIARGALFGATTAGGSYLDYQKLKDANNQPLDPAIVKGAALSTGVLNSILQEKVFSNIASEVPAFHSLMPEGMKSMLASQTMRGAIANYLTMIAGQAGAQGGVGWINSMAQSGGGALAKMVSDGTIHQMSPTAILSTIFSPENLKQAGEETKANIALGGAMSAGYWGYDFAKNYTNILHATNAAQGYKDMGEKIQNMKMLQHSPEKTEEAIQAIVAGPDGNGPARNTYVPVRDFNEHYQGKEIDPREAFKAITGNYDGYDEASRTGADLQIPTEKYLTTIGVVPEDNNALSKVIRTDPEAMNAEEAKKASELIKKEKTGKSPEDEIKDAMMAPNIPPPLPTPETEPITPAPAEIPSTPEGQAVQAAEYKQGFNKPLIEDPFKFLPEKEATEYQQAIADSTAKAKEILARKIVDRKLQESSTAWNDERNEIKKDVDEELKSHPVYRSLDILQKPMGTDTGLGFPSFKLSKSDIAENDKNEPGAQYPRGISVDGGMPIDQAADLLGFDSGSKMLFELRTMPPRDEFLEKEADTRMMERHPDPTAGGNIVQEAMRAVHNDKRSQLLRLELKILASEHMAQLKGVIRRITRPIPTMKQVRDDAIRDVSAKPVQDIKPSLYSQEEARSAREAGEHLANGDIHAAFEAKQRELINHEHYLAAVHAREEIAKDLNYVKRLNKESVRERIGKASGGQVDYLAQVDDILDRFDFRKSTTLKSLGRQQSLREFIQNQQAQGYSPEIPEEILNDLNRKNYKNLTKKEFDDVVESLKTIQNLAELKGELLANAKQRSFDAAKDDIIETINQNHDIKIGPLKPRMTNESHFIPSAAASMARIEFLVDRLAGDKAMSPIYQMLFKPTVNAQNVEREMMIDKMYKMGDLALQKIFDVYTPSERAQWYNKKTYIKEIDADMLKPNILMVGLNQGNPYNQNALDEGYKWNPEQRKAILDHLDERDWTAIQNIWDHLESYWPDIVAQEKRLNGRAPQKVEIAPLTVNIGDGKTLELKGGYFPILFDKTLSPNLARIDEANQAIDLFGGQYAQAMTRNGHTIARTDAGGKPLLLQLSALTSHIENVIHDLAWRKTIIDLNHLINDSDIRAHMKAAIGDENYAQFNPWLQKIAGERMPSSTNPYEQLVGKAKGMATAVNLGFSVTAGIKHLTNFGMTTNEIGMKYALHGFKEVFSNPMQVANQWRKIAAESKVMSAFDENYDRDVRDMFKGMNIAGVREGLTFLPESMRGPQSVMDVYTHDMKKAFFWHFGFMYKGVSMPAYIGAKMKALDGKVEGIKAGDNEAAIDYAEHVVRTTIAAGATKDLPNIMNERGLMKMFTMYHGPMNLFLNNFMKATRQSIKDPSKFIGSLLFIWFGAAAIQGIMTGKSPGLDDGADEWAKWLAKTELMFPFESIVGVRDIARAAESRFKDMSITPLADIPVRMGKAAYAVSDFATGKKDELSESDTKNLVTTAGYFTGMPSTQMYKTANYLLHWAVGDEQPSNPMEGIWRALVGAKPK